MSEDMSSSSWRYLNSASSRLSSLKGYIPNRDSIAGWRLARGTQDTPRGEEKQGWRAWAGQKIRVRRRSSYDATELVNVFPGWAARRYAQEGGPSEGPRPFEIEVFVSGYAISYRPPENASRSQRAFIRLAKGFASLPKLVESAADLVPNTPSLAQLTPSTEDLLRKVKLPPRPTEISDHFDVDALERQLKRAKTIPGAPDDDSTESLSDSSSSRSSISDSLQQRPRLIESTTTPAEAIRRLHTNLEERLQPFWSSVLPNRIVRVHLFASPHEEHASSDSATITGIDTFSSSEEEELSFDSEHGPLASQDVVTAADGSFQARFRVKWEELCHHPRALHIAFGEAVQEHELLVVAQLLPLALPTPSRAPSPSSTHDHHPAADLPPPPETPDAPLASLTRIPITHSPIRVISDIDDTVKLSDVLSGVRAVFHNVFVKELRDNVIPGMGEWYAGMYNRGVRFHYVSNGPFEILPVLNEFFQISQLPLGSIKLRSYAGRSLFNGLMSAPAARKRAGVVDVLDSFPDSRFFLIGDTGEQDLELYADLARERPHQILGVFIRDADSSTIGGPEPIDDPTGWNAMGAAGTRPNARPLAPRTESAASEVASTSEDSAAASLRKYDYSSNDGKAPQPVGIDTNETPRPNRYTLDGSGPSGLGKGGPSSLDDNALAKAREQQAYFGTRPLSTEPESFDGPALCELTSANANGGAWADPLTTPTPPSAERMAGPGPSIIVDEKSNIRSQSQPKPQPPSSSSSTQLSPPFITTEPPKPTPPPSMRSSRHHKFSPYRLTSSSTASFRSQQTDSSTSSSASSSAAKKAAALLSEAEKKRQELQMRVYRARTQMPSHVPLRVFRDASECVEVEKILDGEGWDTKGGAGPDASAGYPTDKS